MQNIKLIKLVSLLSVTAVFAQSDNSVTPKEFPNRVQVTVSGNHPDAIDNKSTVIFDNTKNIDLRTNNRPIKDIIPPNDTEEELFLPNEVIPTLSIEESDLNSLPETEPIRVEEYQKITSGDISDIISQKNNLIYTGTRKQNIQLMKALGIKKGWSKNEKWPDGTDVDDYSIVDWLKAGEGFSKGIEKDATIEVRKDLFNKYVISNQTY